MDDKGAVATDTVNIAVIDTLTTSGKEYLFPGNTWTVEGNDVRSTTHFVVARPDLFYTPGRNIEISTLADTSTVWEKLPRVSQVQIAETDSDVFGYEVSPFSNYWVVFYKSRNNRLFGTQASIKVKFL